MIARFFKKKPAAAKKASPEKPKAEKAPIEKPKAKQAPSRLLTAEGWKRMMMRKSKK